MGWVGASVLRELALTRLTLRENDAHTHIQLAECRCVRSTCSINTPRHLHLQENPCQVDWDHASTISRERTSDTGRGKNLQPLGWFEVGLRLPWLQRAHAP
jgi:hypothetical protein